MLKKYKRQLKPRCMHRFENPASCINKANVAFPHPSMKEAVVFSCAEHEDAVDEWLYQPSRDLTYEANILRFVKSELAFSIGVDESQIQIVIQG